MKPDLSKLDDRELYVYFTEIHPDRNMRIGALLLSVALHNEDREIALLRRIARTGEKFVFTTLLSVEMSLRMPSIPVLYPMADCTSQPNNLLHNLYLNYSTPAMARGWVCVWGNLAQHI